MTAALCLLIIDGGCLHTDSNLSITTIEHVFFLSLSHSTNMNQLLLFSDSNPGGRKEGGREGGREEGRREGEGV